MGFNYFLVKKISIAKIINIQHLAIKCASKIARDFFMSKEAIRKTNTYQIQTMTLHEEFKTSFMDFNNLVDDLVIELKKIIRDLSVKSQLSEYYNKNNSLNQTNELESIFYKISKITSKTDEILQNIGGLEFSTSSIIDQFTKVLKAIEIQYNNVIMSYKSLNINFKTLSQENKNGFDLNDDLSQLEIEFVLLQEAIQSSLPKVNILFDELHETEINALKFSNINNF